jgi:hypothetical protein
MSNHLKYEDPTLSNQQAAMCHSTISKWWKLKIKTFVLNKIYHPIQKKCTSQNVKSRRAKQISVM